MIGIIIEGLIRPARTSMLFASDPLSEISPSTTNRAITQFLSIYRAILSDFEPFQAIFEQFGASEAIGRHHQLHRLSKY